METKWDELISKNLFNLTSYTSNIEELLVHLQANTLSGTEYDKVRAQKTDFEKTGELYRLLKQKPNCKQDVLECMKKSNNTIALNILKGSHTASEGVDNDATIKRSSILPDLTDVGPSQKNLRRSSTFLISRGSNSPNEDGNLTSSERVSGPLNHPNTTANLNENRRESNSHIIENPPDRIYKNDFDKQPNEDATDTLIENVDHQGGFNNDDRHQNTGNNNKPSCISKRYIIWITALITITVGVTALLILTKKKSEGLSRYQISTLKANTIQPSSTEGLFDFPNCFSLKNEDLRLKDGIYEIFPTETSKSQAVWCDMQLEDGGWTVFQKRGYLQENDFNRTWDEYSKGFGNPRVEDYWLGLETLHVLTKSCNNEINIDLGIGNETMHFMRYSTFRVANSSDHYRITLGDYQSSSSNVHDLSSQYVSGKQFSTFDKVDDGSPSSNCATIFGGGWWCSKGYSINPNGKKGSDVRFSWTSDNGTTYYDIKTELKIRPRCGRKDTNKIHGII